VLDVQALCRDTQNPNGETSEDVDFLDSLLQGMTPASKGGVPILL
jgi:hypothetical protein